jgi:hypothetical protein
LRTHYKQEELAAPGFYLSSNARMNILEDLIDVYLAYIYDKELKMKVIVELVQNVWNDNTQGPNLDP